MVKLSNYHTKPRKKKWDRPNHVPKSVTKKDVFEIVYGTEVGHPDLIIDSVGFIERGDCNIGSIAGPTELDISCLSLIGINGRPFAKFADPAIEFAFKHDEHLHAIGAKTGDHTFYLNFKVWIEGDRHGVVGFFPDRTLFNGISIIDLMSGKSKRRNKPVPINAGEFPFRLRVYSEAMNFYLTGEHPGNLINPANLH
jgi:hypothetical protein